MSRLFLITVLVLVTACSEEYPHRFQRGDCVTIKLTGDRGMVKMTYKYHGTVAVRLGRAGTTNSSLLGLTIKDNEYLAVKHFADFELDRCD